MSIFRTDYLDRIRETALAAATELDRMSRGTDTSDAPDGRSWSVALDWIAFVTQQAEKEDLNAISALQALVSVVSPEALQRPKTVADLLLNSMAWTAAASLVVSSRNQRALEILRDQFLEIHETACGTLDEARRI